MSSEKATLDGLRIDRKTAPQVGLQRGVVAWVLVLIVLVGVVVWWFYRPKSILVRTVAAQRTTAGGPATLLNASGYVTARRQATVSSKVTGKVIEVLVEEGKRVELGQILARVDPSNVEKSLRLVEAQLEAARKALDETQANLEAAEREHRRTIDLAANHVTSQSALDRAEADAKSLRARLAKQQADVVVAEREVAQWQQQLDDTIIRAPFPGIVTIKNAQPGEMISPMSAGGSFTRTGICTLVDMSSLEVEVDVNESYINRVEPGQPVEATLDAYSDWHIPAHVIAIIPTADRQKATVKVRVGFEKLEARILPEMGVKVAFRSAETGGAPRAGVSIPKAAVQTRDGHTIVWVVKNEIVERRAVAVTATLGNEVAIAGGLNDGERVAIEGTENLTDGARVKEAKP